MALEPDGAVFALDDIRLVFLVLFLDVADNLVEHILQRDEAGGAAELIEHHSHLSAVLLELVQEQLYRECLWHEEWLVHHAPGAEIGPGLASVSEEILQVEHPDDVIDAALIDRDAREGALLNHLRQLIIGDIHGHALDLRAMDHDLPGRHVAEAEHTLQKLALRLIQHAALVAGIDQDLELVHRVQLMVRRRLLHAQETHEEVPGAVERPDEGRHQANDYLHRLADPKGRRFGIEQRHGLRHELSQDHVEKGDGEKGESDGDLMGGALCMHDARAL